MDKILNRKNVDQRDSRNELAALLHLDFDTLKPNEVLRILITLFKFCDCPFGLSGDERVTLRTRASIIILLCDFPPDALSVDLPIA